ncbi:UNVERIFIED_CONTAM: hypothetical protein FKN15_033843 [Acipenser sinensis]
MRLVQFRRGGGPPEVRVGVQQREGGELVDLNSFDPSLPHSMRGFLERGESGLDTAQRWRPMELDWEVELAFVIGKTGKHIKEEEALGHVAGFTVAHDVSARDWQMKRNGKQWLLGKTFDTFCPLGPAIVTTGALSDPHNLGIRCRVNGDPHNLGIRCRVNGGVVQDSSTNQMVFKTEALVSWVSQFVTLYPGDVFLTGTPPGVGVFRKPPVFLKVRGFNRGFKQDALF